MTIIRIPESPTAGAFLQALLCRKHKTEEVAGLRLHPWNARETTLQAGIRGERKVAA